MSESYINRAPLRACFSILSSTPPRPKKRLLSDFGKITLLAIAAAVIMAASVEYVYEAPQMRSQGIAIVAHEGIQTLRSSH